MGHCFSSCWKGYDADFVLHHSILSQLIPEALWDSFLTSCESEKCIVTLANNKPIRLSKSSSFFIVILGEIHAKCKVNDSDTLLRRYVPGDVLHVYGNGFICNDGSISNGNVTIEFVAVTTSRASVTILQLNEEFIDSFVLKYQPHDTSMHPLGGFARFSKLNIGHMLMLGDCFYVSSSSGKNNHHIIAPLLQLQLVTTGEGLQYVTPPPEAKTSKVNKSIPLPLPEKCPALLLDGEAILLSKDITVGEFRHRHHMFPRSMRSRNGDRAMGYRKRYIQVMSPRFSSTSTSKVFAWNDDSLPASPTSPSDLCRSGDVIGVGQSYGFGYYFIKDFEKGLHNIIASKDSIIGKFQIETLDSLMSVFPEVITSFKTKFCMRTLSLMSKSISILENLEPEDLELLSNKSVYRTFQSNDVVCNEGDKGEFLYLIVQGTVMEMENQLDNVVPIFLTKQKSKKSMRISGLDASSSKLLLHPPILFSEGHCFGEVAVITNTFHKFTIRAAESTILLCLPQQCLQEIFDRDRSRICELNIRMKRESVELEHLIGFPTGYNLVLRFAESEMASESLQFWWAAERFNEMMQCLKTDFDKMCNSFYSRHSSSDGNEVTLAKTINTMSLRKQRDETSGIIEMKLRELYDVANSIIKEFIVHGAEKQINIPGSMREEIEKSIEEWLEEINGEMNLNIAGIILAIAADLFQKSKKEVYELLKKDTYLRFKATNQFKEFVTSMKPYNRQRALSNLIGSSAL